MAAWSGECVFAYACGSPVGVHVCLVLCSCAWTCVIYMIYVYDYSKVSIKDCDLAFSGAVS